MIEQSEAQWATDAWTVFREYIAQGDRSLPECAAGVADFLRENDQLSSEQHHAFYHRLLQEGYPCLQALQLAAPLLAPTATAA